MRLSLVSLRAAAEEQALRIHERLTVITGLSRSERQGLVEVVLGTLAGEATVPSELAYVDRQGRRVTVEQTGEGAFHHQYEDGAPAPALSSMLGLSVYQLFELMYVDARPLGMHHIGPGEPRQLAEARSALAALTDQLDTARVARDAANALRLEVIALDEELRQVELGRPRRRYARLLHELESLRAERAALSATREEAESDRVLAAHLALLRPIVDRWRDAARVRDDEARKFGDRVRLDPHSLAGALSVPDRVPPNLDALADALAAAETERTEVSARLAALMAAHVATPSHPEVARLARADLDRLWTVAIKAVQAGERLERESLALGGLMADGEAPAPALVQELESAHEAVEAAHETIEKRRFGAVAAAGGAALGAVALAGAPLIAPLALAGAASAAYWAVLAPRQQLAEAQSWEAETLVKAGVPSYLAFHLRRMEAMHDPALRHNLEKATQAHRRVMAEWRALAGEVAPGEALALRDEVTAYAARVNSLDGLGQDIEDTKRKLTTQIEPAVEKAREALMKVCRPFGIENPVLAADLVRQLAGVAARARAQHAVELAEAAEVEARQPLEDFLNRVGLTTGRIIERLRTFEERAGVAAERVRFRTLARNPEDLDREIARLERLSHSEYRPEFGQTFTAADGHEPNPEELARRRDMTAMAYQTASKLVPDLALIADRRSALERRVAVLEQEHGEAGVPSPSKVTEVEHFLRDRLAALDSCGPAGERLPLLLDDCFANLRADAKWAMLDLVDRLSGSAQVVYLTDDADVITWARRRAAAGTVGHLDPLALAV